MNIKTPDIGAADQSNRLDPTLSHVDTWAFDLDNTLYPASCNLFAQVDVLIHRFIVEHVGLPPEEARTMQKTYWKQHGTTMKGLMIEHGVDPEHFLDYVHAIDHSPVEPSPALDRALSKIGGTKYIFTNASVGHAQAVLDRLGITHHFADIFDIVAADFHPKPHDIFYDTFIERHNVDPTRTILLDDMAKNLAPAHVRGMTTVHIRTGSDVAMAGHDAEHVHHGTEDLLVWLETLLDTRAKNGFDAA